MAGALRRELEFGYTGFGEEGAQRAEAGGLEDTSVLGTQGV